MPMEGMTLAISDCFPNIEFHKIKIIVDCSSVAIGVVLSFLFLHGLFGIREGTILSAILVGKILPVMKKRISPVIFENNENTNYGLFAGLGFVAAVRDITAALSVGSTLYIVPSAIRKSITDLVSFYKEKQITITFLPPHMGRIAWYLRPMI